MSDAARIFFFVGGWFGEPSRPEKVPFFGGLRVRALTAFVPDRKEPNLFGSPLPPPIHMVAECRAGFLCVRTSTSCVVSVVFDVSGCPSHDFVQIATVLFDVGVGGGISDPPGSCVPPFMKWLQFLFHSHFQDRQTTTVRRVVNQVTRFEYHAIRFA